MFACCRTWRAFLRRGLGGERIAAGAVAARLRNGTFAPRRYRPAREGTDGFRRRPRTPPCQDILTGDSGADVFTFSAGQGLVTDLNAAEGAITPINFGADCDLLAELSTDPAGTSLDLGAGGCVLIPGRTAAEFSADEFLLA